MRDIRVASVQFEHAPGDKKANMTKINNFVKQAAAEKVELLVFPKCCITGCCFMRHLSHEELVKLAEPVFDGPSSQELLSLAREHNMTIGAGLIRQKTRCITLMS